MIEGVIYFISGLIKYLCKPSSWSNIKLSNLEVFYEKKYVWRRKAKKN